MATEVQIEKKSFSKIWEDLSEKVKVKIRKDYIEETGNSKATFYNRKNGEGNTPMDESEALLIEEIFERYHYHQIWD